MKKIGALLLLLIFVFALPVQAEKIRFKDKDSDFKNYSRIQFMGISTVQIDNTDFEIPVYLIQGDEDILTPKEQTEKYYDKIKAPEKKYYLLPQTAHGFNLSVLETQR